MSILAAIRQAIVQFLTPSPQWWVVQQTSLSQFLPMKREREPSEYYVSGPMEHGEAIIEAARLNGYTSLGDPARKRP